jgi:hypothetical protein
MHSCSGTTMNPTMIHNEAGGGIVSPHLSLIESMIKDKTQALKEIATFKKSQ